MSRTRFVRPTRFVRSAGVLLVAALLASCGTDATLLESANHATSYNATLAELNDSGARGHATIVARGDEVRVNLNASGLLAGATHLQHIHGFTAGTVAVCPTAENDVDGDGFVSLFEGAPVYGPILIELGTDARASFGYSRVFPLAPAAPLDEKHIIVHGLDVDGDGDLDGSRDLNGDGKIGDSGNPLFDLTEAAFELTMPVLCGAIDRAGGGRR